MLNSNHETVYGHTWSASKAATRVHYVKCAIRKSHFK